MELKAKQPQLKRIQVCVSTEYRFDYDLMKFEELKRVQKIEYVTDEKGGYWTSYPIAVEENEPLYDAVINSEQDGPADLDELNAAVDRGEM